MTKRIYFKGREFYIRSLRNEIQTSSMMIYLGQCSVLTEWLKIYTHGDQTGYCIFHGQKLQRQQLDIIIEISRITVMAIYKSASIKLPNPPLPTIKEYIQVVLKVAMLTAAITTIRRMGTSANWTEQNELHLV